MRIGTSGYSYLHWKSFYSGAPDLRKYAETFDTVEINNTFYRFPTVEIIKEWIKQVPRGFLFAVKAPLIITHRLRIGDKAWPLVRKFLSTLRAFGRHLGPILFQFPPNFMKTSENEKRIKKLIRLCRGSGRRVAIEFRHPSWDHTVMKTAAKVIPINPITTPTQIEKMLSEAGGFIYIRFHPGAIYKARLRRIYNLLTKIKKEIYIYFNNDERGNALDDAEFILSLTS